MDSGSSGSFFGGPVDTDGARLYPERPHGLFALLPPRGDEPDRGYPRGPVGMLDACIRGEIERSRESDRGGGGKREIVGDVDTVCGFGGPCDSIWPFNESRFAIAAGAVGGDRSDISGYVL